MSKGLIHHIEIYVSDLKSSINFWGEFLEELGYETFQSWESGQSWKIGETYIVFVQAEERFMDIPYHRCRVGLNHLAFHASSRQQVDDMTRKLERKGVKILYIDKHPFAGGEKHYAVYFEDPDRIKVELVAP
ncbi:VOC family protein [Pseudogracilibacillus auburnensis]|uniref:Catechol 2,3-dioxygenase-like lactoylglutathione lyase family enzyme n=1 Tax=Pseudogracilibacillus auburnensis TaxID=1494959 RepID=A0A2V3W6C0_9BACI|nr:VOC family protein [Pseudogracilibacillus auburnensis]MBO1001512.1 VOC family protein [Pseudogracilibacillus auburnensis]PXW89570.1 catechol 2,3-dioxygenase-like lactoylglutathione lyase family enzyme [Pseudogracilibacillus auburnensis]